MESLSLKLRRIGLPEGELRGLLCYRCNTSIGKFEDNIDIMEKAITYLKSYKQ